MSYASRALAVASAFLMGTSTAAFADTISGTDFLRSAATFTTQVSPPRTLWSWSGASNVFGTTVGATVPAVFTQ